MNFFVNEAGFYGEFGGAFVPEMLHQNIKNLTEQYSTIIESSEFKDELDYLLINYVGRPTALYFAKSLTARYKAKIYLKREDLNHTGSHKIINALGQALLAKRLGKTRIIAETGAGQHGVATATACALLKLPCRVYMGEVDLARQATNVSRMKMLGAEVISVGSGSKTLKDATNEAIRDWISNPLDTHYIIGSVVGPHPYPDMVSRFQSVISYEMRQELKFQYDVQHPDYIIACVGGGSNAIGAFYHFLNDLTVKLVGVEAGGDPETKRTAASISLGRPGILHGARTMLLQTEDGQVMEAHSISAGLDYPGVGPQHAALAQMKRVSYISVTDKEALKAGFLLTQTEGIIPALESAHAIAALDKLPLKESDHVVINLSGRGDKDLETYLSALER